MKKQNLIKIIYNFLLIKNQKIKELNLIKNKKLLNGIIILIKLL